MTAPHDEAVAAAGNALFRHRAECQANGIEASSREYATTAITAYLSHLRAAGFVVARVPDAMPDANSSPYVTYPEDGTCYAHGWNACRAAMLEGDKP